MYKKAWYIEGYTMDGAVYCRECVAETLNDESFNDPYTTTEDASFTPIFTSDLDIYREDGLECEYCFIVIYEGE